jgi:hypothetical protein
MSEMAIFQQLYFMVRDDDDTRLAASAYTALDSLFVQWECSDTGSTCTISISHAFG